jgi:hypothetical protein
MQTALLGATALALVAAVDLSFARAEGPKPSGRTSWSGISQSIERDADPFGKPLVQRSKTPGH